MTIEELKQLYLTDQLVEAIVEPSMEEGLWVLEFRHIKGGFVLLTDSQGEECHYQDLDNASQTAMDVGFRQVRIETK